MTLAREPTKSHPADAGQASTAPTGQRPRPQTPPAEPHAAKEEPKGPGKVPDELLELLQRAEQGDESVLPQMHETLNKYPWIWQVWGDIGRHAEEAQIRLIAGPTNLVLRECLAREGEAKLLELLEAGDSPLEQLLAQRVVATWLQVQYADTAAAQAGSTDVSPARRKLLDSRQTTAQNRHLAAIKALATVRKLVKPALSPMELAKRPVAETCGQDAATLRMRPGNPARGVPVTN